MGVQLTGFEKQIFGSIAQRQVITDQLQRVRFQTAEGGANAPLPFRNTPTMTAFPTPLKYGAVPNPCNGQPPVVCSNEERLLLMASSYGKADRPEQRVAPIDLYTGVMFKSLRTWLPKLERTRIIILSAKH